MSFKDIKQRVLACLSKTKTLSLQSEISRRIASDPLKYLDGSEVTSETKFSIFKHSLISIYPKRKEDAEYNSALHLIKTILDSLSCIKESPSVERASSEIQSKDNKGSKPTKQKKERKQKQRIESTSLNKTSSKPDFELSAEPEQVECAMEIGAIPATLLVQPQPVETIDESLPTPPDHESEESSKSNSSNGKKRRTRNKKRIGSATPGNPSNKRVATELFLEDPRGVDTDIGDKDVWCMHWSRLASLISLNEVPKMLEGSPRDFGISCRADKVVKCSDCISTVLSCPFTFCDSVKCENVSHHGMGLHSMSEFDIQSFHDGKFSGYPQLWKDMFNADVIPSLIYVMLHDRNAKKLKPLNVITSSLNKCIDTYMSLSP